MKERQETSSQEVGKPSDSTGILAIRLDTQVVIDRVKIFLTGQIQSVVMDENGNPYFQTEKITQAKANPEGVHSILNMVENVVNTAVVQGNFDDHLFDTYIDFVHDSLLTNIMANLYIWGINENDYEPICDNIMAIITPYMTRLLHNKERESYNQTLRVLENQSVKQSGNKIFG